MIKTYLYSLALVIAAGLSGCAGSDGTKGESQPLAVDNTETSAITEASTDSAARETDYSQMFASVDNTARFDLATLVKMDPNLSTFAALVEQAELSDALLQQEEALTVFAPTNEAFAEWPQDSLNTLMKTENTAQLIKLLQGHILLPKKVNAAGLSSSQRIETGGGEYIMVAEADSGSGITIGGASIVKADVAASNGLLHVVDKVIAPIVDPIDQF